jgi:hypothetical protein
MLILRLLLGADKQKTIAVERHLAHLFVGFFQLLAGLVQVNDVDIIALAVNIRLHLRVPLACVVSEVHARFQQLFHRTDWHCVSLGCASFSPIAVKNPQSLFEYSRGQLPTQTD